MQKKYIYLFLLFFVVGINQTFIQAQQLDMDKFKGLKVRQLGPAGMSGRITAIDVVESNQEIIYVGSASGGLWKSVNGGIAWKAIFDKEEVSSIGAVKINQNNPDEIWLGTGEGNPRNSVTSGFGVYRSLDAGNTWQFMGLGETRNIHRIIIDKNDPNTVYVGAIGSPWGAHKERGLYKSTDKGKTWKQILYKNELTGVGDMVADPRNPNKMFVAMWEHKRSPWYFNSGGKEAGLYLTFDGGKSWKKLGKDEGFPTGKLGRIGVAISRSNPKVVYAIVESAKNAIYRSSDGGNQWQKMTDKGNFGNRPFYYSEIYVDPKNENRIFSLWSYVSMSEDAGRTWKVIADYGNNVHPDHHAFWISPKNPNFLIDGNDGGLNISRDGGKNWRFVQNLPVGQFYHINIDNEYPYRVMGGMQDNGSWIGQAYTWQSGGIRNADWREVLFGDGFDVMPDPSDKNTLYAMWQGGNVARINLETGQNKSIKPVHPTGEELRFNWNAAIAQDPFNKTGLYFGSQFVHRSTDKGNSWTIISPDLTTNDTLKQKQDDSGGLTYDVTGAENHTTTLCIAPSPKDENVIWVGTDDGNLQLTKDGGKNWENLISRIKSLPKNAWIPQIHVSEYAKEEAFVVVNNYRQNDWKPYLYHTKDFGKTWTNLVDEKQVSGHCLSIVQDPVEPKLLFLGTERGLYISIDKGKNWTKWTQDFPTVPVRDMKIHPREHDLVIGTFGRAIYILDDIRPLRTLATKGTEVLDKTLHLFEPPQAVLADYKRASGARFIAQAEFTGENRPNGAMLTFVFKKVKKEEKKDEKKEEKKDKKPQKKNKNKGKIKVEVLQASEVIRTFYVMPKEEGINRIYWNLRRTGVRYPSYRIPKKDADEPTGQRVLPGKYDIKMSYTDANDKLHESVQTIQVIADPRKNILMSDMEAKNRLIEKLQGYVAKTSDMTTALAKALKTANIIAKQSEENEILTEKTKEIKKKIKELQELILSPKGKQGIIRRPNILSAVLGQAGGYLQSSWEKPTEAEITLVNNAEKMTKEVLQKVNQFFKEDWTTYQKAVEASKFSIFEEYEEIKE